MTALIVALLLVALYWTLLYRGVSLAVFTGVTAAVVVALGAIGVLGPLAGAAVAPLVAIPALIFNTPWRCVVPC